MNVAELIQALQGYDPEAKVVVNVYDPALQAGNHRKDLFYENVTVEATRTTKTHFVELGVKVGEDEDSLRLNVEQARANDAFDAWDGNMVRP